MVRPTRHMERPQTSPLRICRVWPVWRTTNSCYLAVTSVQYLVLRGIAQTSTEVIRRFLPDQQLRTIAGVSGAVLEDVRLAVYGKDDRAFVGVGLVERPDPSPDEFAPHGRCRHDRRMSPR